MLTRSRTGIQKCKQIQSKSTKTPETVQCPENSEQPNTPKHTRIKTRTKFWIQKGYSEKHILFCWRSCTDWYICDTAKTYVRLDPVAIETWPCNILKLVVKVAFLKHLALLGVASSISPYIKHYEGLSYDREALHRRHLRARRATASQENTLKLDFTAFHRWFHLFLFLSFSLLLNIYTFHHLNMPVVDRFTDLHNPSDSLHVFFQDFPPAFETWLGSFVRKFHCDHWKWAHTSRHLPHVLRNIGGWVFTWYIII